MRPCAFQHSFLKFFDIRLLAGIEFTKLKDQITGPMHQMSMEPK